MRLSSFPFSPHEVFSRNECPMTKMYHGGKDLWAQEVRPKRDILERRNQSPFNRIRLWIFFHQIIFSKKAVFFEKMVKKNFLRDMTIFQEKGSSYAKNQYNLLYHKLVAKYFHITQFVRKKQYFLKKQQKTVCGDTFDHFFRKRRHLTPKLNLTFYIRN